ncbi:DinB family protein [Aegicerativicinus sediminis]
MRNIYGNLAVLLLFPIIVHSQGASEQLPFREISDYPEVYSAESVVTRLIEGLGFRFYWATETIRDEDLLYKPSESGRSFGDTVNHIYSLSNVILNGVLSQPNSGSEEELSFEAKRKAVLINLQKAIDVIIEGKKLDEMKTVFPSSNGTNEFPFWNQINGPISDAIWHCGQLVVMRRASGNPIPSGPSFFNGKVRQ